MTRIRIALVVLTTAAYTLVTPPVWAGHNDPPLSNWPCSPGVHPSCVAAGAAAAVHEEMPDLAIVDPVTPCVVTGTLLAAPITIGGPQHGVVVPGVNNDPGHSHFTFVDTLVACGLVVHDVAADGGNDGHMIDVFDPFVPAGGANGDVVEVDPLDDCTQPGDPDGGPCGGDDGVAGSDHDFNDHHGTVNESSWSHSSGYAGGMGGGESNACGPPGFDAGGANQNKADIVVDLVPGWMKYIRLGVVLFIWGCNTGLAGTNDFFSGSLVLAANATTPGAAIPVAGVAATGPGWLIDREPPT